MDENEKCPACGGDMTLHCSVNGISLCRMCCSGGNIQIALRIVRHGQKEKLEKIFANLEAE